MNRFFVYPYLMGSAGARSLAGLLGTIQIRPNGRYQPRPNHTVINWGSTHFPNWWGEHIARRTYNKPPAVGNASDKIRAFQLLSAAAIPTPLWTTDRTVALSWFATYPEAKVVCRTLTRASEGRGIVIALRPEELVSAPLYTLYTRKQVEYRVHAGMGRVFDVQQKRKRNGFVGGDKYVRNTANGWVFCREGVAVSDEIKATSVNAVRALGLDFGAVDVGLGAAGYVVYEVNTAPGLEGQTGINYANFFRGAIAS